MLQVNTENQLEGQGVQCKYKRHSSVVSNIARRKLQLFRHVCRMDDDRLVKTVMLSMVDRDRTRGRPPRRWVDIIDWCGCAFPTTFHLTVNRIQWNEKIDDVVTGLDGPSVL